MTLILSIEHAKQKSSWDCGITCLQMLTNFYREDSSVFEQILHSYQCNQSTWTIDLLHLLHQLNIPAILHTITIGCSSTYDQVPYYERLIDQDRERVNRLFDMETANVRLDSIEWEEIKKHLIEHRTPCLVLVDANQLTCCTCYRTTFNRFLDKILPTTSSSYQGHYILVIGFTSNANNEFIRYVDPGRQDPFCTTTKENFDQARMAFGTDEDVIFCYPKEQRSELSG